jgi:hypothetical protein
VVMGCVVVADVGSWREGGGRGVQQQQQSGKGEEGWQTPTSGQGPTETPPNGPPTSGGAGGPGGVAMGGPEAAHPPTHMPPPRPNSGPPQGPPPPGGMPMGPPMGMPPYRGMMPHYVSVLHIPAYRPGSSGISPGKT